MLSFFWKNKLPVPGCGDIPHVPVVTRDILAIGASPRVKIGEIVYRRLVLAARGKKGKAGIISLSTISFLPTSTALSTSERRASRAGAVLGRSAARYCRGRAERPPSHAGSGQHVTITSLAGPLTPLVLLRRSPPPPRTAPAMDAPAPTWPNRQNPKAALLPSPPPGRPASPKPLLF